MEEASKPRERMKIESYEFGRITIGGKTYTSDVVVYPEGVDDGWWRREGHKLHVEDIREIVQRRPEVLVVGTGHDALMKIPPETQEHVRSKGVSLIAKGTKEACEIYNQLVGSRRVIAALHLTC